jgi:hypothetical protein
LGWACSTHEKDEKLIKIITGKPEGQRPLGGHRHRWNDNIKIDLREKGWEIVDWIRLAKDSDQRWALVDTVMNLLVS